MKLGYYRSTIPLIWSHYLKKKRKKVWSCCGFGPTVILRHFPKSWHTTCRLETSSPFFPESYRNSQIKIHTKAKPNLGFAQRERDTKLEPRIRSNRTERPSLKKKKKMGKQPVRMKAVIYALSPFQQKVMPGLWKDLPSKIHHKVSENWLSAALLLTPLVATYT